VQANAATSFEARCLSCTPWDELERMGGERRIKPKKEKGLETMSTKVTGKTIHQLMEHQEFKCALTGVELTPEMAALDHIVPVSGGGGDDIHNCQILWSEVNRAKGTMRQDEFVEMCTLVSKHGEYGSLIEFRVTVPPSLIVTASSKTASFQHSPTASSPDVYKPVSSRSASQSVYCRCSTA